MTPRGEEYFPSHGLHFGSHGFGSHFGGHDGLHGSHGLQSFRQQSPRSTLCVWSRSFDCLFDCVAVFDAEESTQLPLFWRTSPLFNSATLSPLSTNGFDVAR